MNISVIIPIKKYQPNIKTIKTVLATDYPKDKLEIIVIEGNLIAHQRNVAAQKATGKILCFLDDDLNLDNDYFTKSSQYFNNNDVAIIGGPVLIDKSGNFFQQMVGLTFGNIFGTYDVRYRHKAMGNKVKYANESMLIACNFLIKKNIFLNEGGFNEGLYANEDNELVNRLSSKKYKILYVPSLAVYRKYRNNILEFIAGIVRDGTSRVDHYCIAPRFFQIKYFAPFLFTIYLISIYFCRFSRYGLLPLIIYSGLTVMAGSYEAIKIKSPRAFFCLCVLFIVMHISYGLGTAWGIIKNIFKLNKYKVITPKIMFHKKLGDQCQNS